MQIDSSISNIHQRRAAVDTEPSLDFNQQRLRILSCTALAMATGAGGLRFKPGTRPWLEGLLPSPAPRPQPRGAKS